MRQRVALVDLMGVRLSCGKGHHQALASLRSAPPSSSLGFGVEVAEAPIKKWSSEEADQKDRSVQTTCVH